MSTNQHERLAVETPEERETRLQQMRDRRAAETPEERIEIRGLQYDTWNNSVCSHNFHCFNNIPSMPPRMRIVLICVTYLHYPK